DGRVGGVAGAGPGRAGLDEDGAVGAARVEDQTADADAADVSGLQDRVAAVRHQRGQAEAEHDGVGVVDVDRAVDLVHAGGEQQVLSARKRGVDLRDRTARRRDVEIAYGQRGPRRITVRPRDALCVRPVRGHEHVPAPGGVDVQVRLLVGRRGLVYRRVRRAGEALARNPGVA